LWYSPYNSIKIEKGEEVDMGAVMSDPTQNTAPKVESVKNWTLHDIALEVAKLKKGESRIFLIPTDHVLVTTVVAGLALIRLCPQSKINTLIEPRDLYNILTIEAVED
jgi:hypothetical protein